IGVVEAQMAAATELLCDAEIKGDRLSVADMQIAVGLRWKAGHHRGVAFGSEVRFDDIANEIAPRLRHHRSSFRHATSHCGRRGLCAKSAGTRQDRRAAKPLMTYVTSMLNGARCPPKHQRRRTVAKPPEMTETIVTRFAPSPTGFLHIGGARTALF